MGNAQGQDARCTSNDAHPVFRPLGRCAPFAVNSGLRPETRTWKQGAAAMGASFFLSRAVGLALPCGAFYPIDGEAGNSGSMLPACVTVSACKRTLAPYRDTGRSAAATQGTSAHRNPDRHLAPCRRTRWICRREGAQDIRPVTRNRQAPAKRGVATPNAACGVNGAILGNAALC